MTVKLLCRAGTHCCVEGAGLAECQGELVAVVPGGSCEAAKGGLHLGEQAHSGVAADAQAQSENRVVALPSNCESL